MPTELEQLKLQRKELDKRIRELEHPSYQVDGAKLFFKTYNTNIKKSNEWVVTLEEIDETTPGRTWAYKKIISAKCKENAVIYIENQIKILSELLKAVYGQ